MKAFLLAVLTVTHPGLAHADNYTCLRDHEEAGAQRVDAALKAGVVAALKKLGIQLKEGTLQSDSSFTYHQEEERTDQWVTHAALSWEGRATTAAGTDLVLFLKQPVNEDSGNYAFFLPVLRSRGFDREGNPIDPHCNLNLSSPFVSNVANAVGVRNARSGKMIATIALPKVIAVY